MNAITLSQAAELIGVEPAGDWNGRRYFSIAGAAYKMYHKGDKLYFKAGKGRSTTEANEIAARVIGCNVTDRHSKHAAYVIIEG